MADEPRVNWVGKRVELRLKTNTDVVKMGVIILDEPGKETRFRTDEGEEVGAYEYLYRMPVDGEPDPQPERLVVVFNIEEMIKGAVAPVDVVVFANDLLKGKVSGFAVTVERAEYQR